ncbi:hypothetical protein AHF37_11731 [Paragonimus kellicotti]|nr:hypothetical protein AHF37_11731 [Paragonimus kellicotti]
MRFFDRNDEDSLFGSYRHTAELLILICMSWVGCAVLKRMFRAYKAEFLRAGFSGVDLNKPTKPTIPEAQGVLAGAVFITIMFLFIPVPFWRYLFDTDLQRELLFKSQVRNLCQINVFQFIHYLAGLLCICCMVFLGFADDALDLPWRHKCLLPSVASLPLLMVYLANEGVTHVVVPTFLRGLMGNTVDIGYLWRVHLFSLYFLIPFIAVCWALYKVNR